MTLLVGVLCKDGAVIAADRQASTANIGVPARKISLVGPNSVFAPSGSPAVGQRVRSVLSGLDARATSLKYAEAVPVLNRAIVDEALIPSYQVPKAMGISPPSFSCLFASKFRDGAHLAIVDQYGNFMEMDDHSPLGCLGSGDSHGLSFLTFMRSVFFAETAPSLSEGALVAYWTVQFAIELQALHVGLGADVCVLPRGEDARILSPEELKENDELIGEIRKSMLSVKDRMGRAIAPRNIPPPPTLSA